MRIARVKTGNDTVDSYVDIAGYADCGGEIATNKERQNEG